MQRGCKISTSEATSLKVPFLEQYSVSKVSKAEVFGTKTEEYPSRRVGGTFCRKYVLNMGSQTL